MSQPTSAALVERRKKPQSALQKNISRDKYLLILLAPAVIFFFIFSYIPMYGVVIAFQRFTFGRGIFGSEWVGFRWFGQFFGSMFFYRLMRNTFLLSIYSLLWGFWVPILFALMLNELRNQVFRRIVQTISYFPYFISVVVAMGIVVNMLQLQDGVVNNLLRDLGREPIEFLQKAEWFRTIYITSGIWQSFGFSSIIYIGAISSIDPQLYEAARVDGASRIRQIVHVTLPGILPVAVTLLILSIGNILNVGFEKIILLYNPATYEVADVISTYVYRKGLVDSQFSFGAAVGLFNSALNLFFLGMANALSKRALGIQLF
jgi:putative aldouronate transport system permease protein